MFLFLMVLVKTITHSILWVEKKSGDVLADFVSPQDLRPNLPKFTLYSGFFM